MKLWIRVKEELSSISIKSVKIFARLEVLYAVKDNTNIVSI